MIVLLTKRQSHFYIALAIAVLTVMGFALGAFALDSKPQLPRKSSVSSFPTMKQLTNYCGPASLSSVLKFWGRNLTQKDIACRVFDEKLQATNGADMLLYARELGFSAYSWNSNLQDLKKKLADGIPVIVLHDISVVDHSGHYRVATGYDDKTQMIYVMDPYETDCRAISYTTFLRLWNPHGNWSLAVMPKSRDSYHEVLSERNSVVHIDLAYVYYRKGRLDEAALEGHMALNLEPGNPDIVRLMNKVSRQLEYAAGSKAKKSAEVRAEAKSVPDKTAESVTSTETKAAAGTTSATEVKSETKTERNPEVQPEFKTEVGSGEPNK